MEKILIQQNRHWKGLRYDGLFHRAVAESVIAKVGLKEIQVLLGIRRGGKSTIFKLLINQLMDETDPRGILYLNLDDPFFAEICRDSKELYRLPEMAEKLTGVKVTHLFLDEVQNVRDWQKFVKSVYDAELFRKIFVTGSNSALLQGEYATLLSGRYVTDRVYPLSFPEILSNNNLSGLMDLVGNRPRVLSLFEQTLLHGSFPEILKIDDAALKREVLVSYYETIVLKDCIAGRMMRDTRIFTDMTHYLLSNIGIPYSYNSLARAVGSNENTAREFVGVMEGSFLLSEVKNFSWSLKQQSKAKKKCFCADNGLISSVAFSMSENIGRLFENLVYCELAKATAEELYFFSEQKECDFIFRKGKELTGVQACFDLNDRSRRRELGGLNAAMEKYGLARGYVVTPDSEERISDKVSVIPFWKMHLVL